MKAVTKTEDMTMAEERQKVMMPLKEELTPARDERKSGGETDEGENGGKSTHRVEQRRLAHYA